jgi:hypothetical protein
MTKQEQQAEALTRATTNQSMSNYPAILSGFTAKGIPLHEIEPRVNVFTFRAWQALGRVVSKGQHGVNVVTYIDLKAKGPDPVTGEIDPRKQGGRKPKTTTVFHIRQTHPIDGAPDQEPPPTIDEPEAGTQAGQDAETGAGEGYSSGTQAGQDRETGAGEGALLTGIEMPGKLASAAARAIEFDPTPSDYSEATR